MTAAERQERFSFTDLATRATNAEREQLMRSGSPPSLESLVGWEFAGLNTAPITSMLGIRKFKKGFFSAVLPGRFGSNVPHIQGYNVVVFQDELSAPHRAKPSEQAPKRHGFFAVHRVQPQARDNRYPNAVLLDYGLGGNTLSPSGLLRDYLVQVYADDPDLLLGRAFLALWGGRISASYFVLKRMNPHQFVPARR